MEKKKYNSATVRSKISVSERSMLIAPSQSKKLTAIRNRVRPEPESINATRPSPDDAAEESNKAQAIIDRHIDQLMQSYPEGKRKRLFEIRYGSIEAIKTLPIEEAYKKLGIDENPAELSSAGKKWRMTTGSKNIRKQ